MSKKKISPREFALEKGVTLQGVYQKVWTGRLPAEKVDGRWLIEIDEPSQDGKQR